MTHVKLATVGVLLLSGAAAHAQQAAGDPLTAALRRQYEGVSRNVMQAAERMPEEKYAFQPTKDVMTFGQLVAHVADYQFISCSQAKGEPNPNTEAFSTLTTKAALVKALGAGIAYCTSVWNGASDRWLLELLPGGRGPAQPRAAPLAFNTSHTNEHYGNIVTYMRINGLVPPSSDRSASPPRPAAP